MEQELPGWDGLERGDALRVVLSWNDGHFIIKPADSRPVLAVCPCCAKPFATARAAKLVADALYPMRRT